MPDAPITRLPDEQGMKYKYSRFTGDDLEGLDLEDLLSQLSDLLLSSGFGNPYDFDETEQTLQSLHDAILDALLNGGLLSDETLEQLMGQAGDDDTRNALEELIQQIMERLQSQG